MIGAVGVGDMFEDIDERVDANRDADFFLHFAMQGGEDRFAMLNLAAGHDPQTVKGVNPPAGEEDTLVLIDDTGND